ncbi:queuosine precursor transporter [Pseudomonas fluorescens]|uniref:queuosine precursor transporter n=1 Tax=Pseudomonas TaxID=286 RepID=UPI000C1478CA|nr:MULTISPECIES: queuosine precursor transporter [Pseudomonas]KAE9657972.1 VUT family protein [Pseudomonas sp. PB105]MBD8194847.1 queuosine precursor transporter [Pseudomonas fluorescens]MBD8229773.1 queuosine precursor transporter [Pseudomonas fluorescens]MBD8239607.1 queuosine precursor transporter [Pseudomonas fluorescens]MBD8787591.1 queuosine precursor transporter [Pseudomonas fluorescens]
MTTYESEIENSKYKLLGFENDKRLAVIMIIATGKIIRVKLSEVLNSEIMDNLNKMEVKNLYKKYYSQAGTVTAYDLNDRNESSWMVYIVLNLLLFTFYIFTSIAATKPIYIESLDIIVTPGTFLYPLTFLIVDLLNENFGLRLARKAILFAFASNAMIIVLLYGSTFLPGLPGWKLDGPYNDVIVQVSSVLIASSISFLVSENINSYLLCKIKELTNSKYLYLRIFLSTFFAVIIDSFLFCFIAFYGAMQTSDILSMIYVQIAIKVGFAFFNILPAYGARSLFKRYLTNAKA